MELSDSDRPVSFGSTSSSASSRDSHGSFGSRMTLVSNSHLGLFPQDKEAGAIKLELMPARPFSSSELPRDGAAGQQSTDQGSERQPWAQHRVEANGATKTGAESATSPKLLYVDRVVQEILETERTYVQDLKSIVEDYLDCIRDQTKLPLGAEERSALFGNIQDIYHFNSELLQDLENCENDPVAIAECFVSKSEEFHIYTQYCTNYPRSVAVLTECMRNKMLAKFFRERQETLKHSLPLGSYLLKPVQRILKYHLLLHEIENHLDKDTEGYDVVLDAIDTMQRVAWHINDMKRKHEHAVRLQEIQSLLTNWKGPDLTSYGELVLEGTFRLQRAKNERTLFLFDKLLLITKKRDDTFTYKAHILCGNLMLVEVIPKEPLSFSVFHYQNPKLQHTVQAKSQQDKRLWVLHLKRLILENHAAKIPAKAKQAILEMDAIHYPGFCYSPEGETKAFCGSKVGSAPYRLRRKSEPSSRLHKVLKTSETAQDIQKVSREEGSPQLTSAGPSPAQRNSQPSSSAIISVLRGGGAVRNIWTDHQIRQALFPSRRSPQENEEDEDDYQMFLPSFSSSDLNSARLCEDSTSSRPCSWHVGQVESSETPSSGHRVVRRASSAGESNTCPPDIRTRDGDSSQYSSRRELQDDPKTEGRGGLTPFGSSIELTIDDIDHVYDNISYEDLKLMVAKREEAEAPPPKSARDFARPKSTPELAFSKRPAGPEKSPLQPRRDGAPPGREAWNQSSRELQVVEENVYDTIGLPDAPSQDFKCSSLKRPKRSTFLGLEADLGCCDSLRASVSQDSLQVSEDEAPYPPGPSDNDYLSLFYNSFGCNLSIADRSISDKLSEEVDEIWNDLENYIKKNEVKARDRLLAAFPVSKDDVQERPLGGSAPELGARSPHPLPAGRARLVPPRDGPGPASCTLDLTPASKDGSCQSLHRLSLVSDLPPVESPYDVAGSSLSPADLENPDPGADNADKTRSRVLLMARQYSQKIKKANQLLKVKSPELEQPPGSQLQKQVPRDLAAILEEKKQGGPAIGARIAEYSQLYDQIVFRETPFKTQKDGWASPQDSSNLSSASPSHTQHGSEDWLLHSTYSNGELADFCPRPEQDLKSKYPTLEINTKSTPRQLSAACSVPSLQTSEPLLSSMQRHSVVVSQPNKENSCQGHLYNSLGRKGISAKSQPYNRSQSSSSILINKSADSINYPSEIGKKQPLSLHRSSRWESHQDLVPGIADSGQQGTEKHSDLTLQDSQKVLVVNRNLPLSAQIATQNYFSNFKETEGDEDDYVEIKSEEDEPISNKLGPYLTSYNDSDKLNDYLWKGPSPNQQNIVQSLREKFQCLSSSSFA
ncbi:pleckstrin homology domain-containing family G member 1 [Balaenoptera acutorostrata]|uniref:Pleckstrin homology domain-containing family G member 1 n=1 Tax=Balaenoptera acutorostrata TaxID=9767 RepID=A0ABM3S2C9_BALAC|nr:pleckstrin homology domain-containing family G member 1 [Balaenoptera acutorostrata]XP_007196946.2 pleckstrin homology domain-containing family G member 1 [Balaenoptera acutorostrata]XP_057383968.1 pleckstrin homology domain-containing family G member 1 [Balaenoptera acutorostrata]XP_057383969.1 pleckstrin homology domain-containing family G member 1 [Balaenoptera acutorostrata]XP_057383970.1 pleckstrin homology domain-containing family G member 1 [Balaenoptera acutorostrata]